MNRKHLTLSEKTEKYGIYMSGPMDVLKLGLPSSVEWSAITKL